MSPPSLPANMCNVFILLTPGAKIRLKVLISYTVSLSTKSFFALFYFLYCIDIDSIVWCMSHGEALGKLLS